MRWVRDPYGRVPERPHYDPEEIDRECESRVAAFLRRRDGAVRFPLSTNDLTILLEEETSDLDLYADLGAGIGGMTEFVAGARPRVRLARDLSEQPEREHRLRTTLAHELGHVWFHAFLWQGTLGLQASGGRQGSSGRQGFSGGQASPGRTQPLAYRGCGQGTILHARPTDWLEWQAGYASGAILMPAGVLRRLVTQMQGAHAFRVTLDTAAGVELLASIQRTFEVSREAARVRLAASGLLPAAPRRTVRAGPGAHRAVVLGAR